MNDNTPRQTSIISAAAKAGRLYGSEVAAERTLRRQALRALDKVDNFVKTGFLSLEEIENKLNVKFEDVASDKKIDNSDDRSGD